MSFPPDTKAILFPPSVIQYHLSVDQWEMIDKCVKHMVEQDVMPKEKARKIMTRYLPLLKRWKAQ